MVHRATARSARDHRHQRGGVDSLLGSAILVISKTCRCPPSNTGYEFTKHPPGGFNRFPLDKLTTSPGGFLCLRFGVKGAPYNTVKVTLSVLADLGVFRAG